MQGAGHLIELARHMEWADAIAWRATLGSEAARADDRIRTWLHHIHTVQHAFVHVWRGETPQLPDLATFPAPGSLAKWGQAGHLEIQHFLASATPEAIERPVRLPWAAEIEQAWNRQLVNPTLGQTALQVPMHSTHHRGQISARLRDLGGEPQYTDFIVWAWWGQPPPDWSFLGLLLADA
jgi:uncharacterized damage-inducible protein DinB